MKEIQYKLLTSFPRFVYYSELTRARVRVSFIQIQST